MALPEGMPANSADVIAALNEHLVLVLNELHEAQDALANMEKICQVKGDVQMRPYRI